MNTIPYKVLITASGVGSGLGELTTYTNKTLIRLGNKPAISYIIESYPQNTEFVITLGHFAKFVKDFLPLAYPHHNFTFVEVDPYEGTGSSLGYSMLKASKYLQQPFIYHASDTIVYERIPKPIYDWIAGYKGQGSSNYTSFNILNNRIQKILEKGILDPDFLHIGLVGINSYEQFWKVLKSLYKTNEHKSGLSDFHVINKLIEKGIHFEIQKFSRWHDVGNIEAIQKARTEIQDNFHILDKEKESIFIFNKSVIKFFYDTKMIEYRIKRAEVLKGLVPKIKSVKDNYYAYNFVEGSLLADVANISNFDHFLEWSEKNLWKPVTEVDNKKFGEICHDFYYNKTKQRSTEFLTTRSLKDTENVINGIRIPSLQEILEKVDFDELSVSQQTNFHGDFILDNIIKTKEKYILLDWRQNFGGLLKAGDRYYDLAKLNHNLTINHDIIKKNLFKIEIDGKIVTCDLYRKHHLVDCQEVLFNFLKKKGYNTKKVKILTSLIWLSSSPLHHHPYDAFLFYFGKYNLWRTLNEKSTT